MFCFSAITPLPLPLLRQKMSFLPFKSRQWKTKNSFFIWCFCLFSKSYLKWMLRACWALLLCRSLVALALALSKVRDGRKGRLVRSVCLSICLCSTLNELTENGKWTWTDRVRHTNIWSIRAAFDCSCPLTELSFIRRPSFYTLKSSSVPRSNVIAMWWWFFYNFFSILLSIL